MATISEFLVALSLDGKGFEKGLKEAESGLQLFGSTALQVGAAVAGALSFKSLTADFAKHNIALDQVADKLGVTRDRVYALDQVTQALGGTANETTGTLERLAKVKAGLLVGDVGTVTAIAKAGLSPDAILGAKDAVEALLNIADRWQSLTRGQRINLASALGLSNAQMALLAKGRKEIERLSGRITDNRKHTDEMSKASYRFELAWIEMVNSVGGAVDPLATSLTDLSAAVMEFFTDVTGEGSKFRDVMKVVADNVDTVAIALGVLVGAKTAAGLAALATGLLRVGASLTAMTVSNPWILGISALAGIGYHLFSDDNVKTNSDDLLGDTKEKKERTIKYIGEGMTPEEARDRVEAEYEQDPEFFKPSAPNLSTETVEKTDISTIIPNHKSARAQIEEKTAPKVTREELAAEKVNKPEKQVSVKQNQDGSKTLTVNLVLDGKVIDRRVFDIVGNAIKVANETGRSTTAR